MNLNTRKKRVSDLLSNLFLMIIIQLISLNHSFAQTDTKEKPNFIFILTDDHRYDLLGSSGNELVKTPHLDQLAQEGILFENAHVTSAICTPSRISILLSQFERKHSCLS